MLISCVPNYGGLATWSTGMTVDFEKWCSMGSSSQGSVLQAIQWNVSKDVLKSNLRWCNIDRTTWEMAAQARSSSRRTCFAGVSEFENNCIVALQEKWARSKENQFITTPHPIQPMSTTSAAAIGLVSHLRSHKRWVSSVNLDGRFHQKSYWFVYTEVLILMHISLLLLFWHLISHYY